MASGPDTWICGSQLYERQADDSWEPWYPWQRKGRKRAYSPPQEEIGSAATYGKNSLCQGCMSRLGPLGKAEHRHYPNWCVVCGTKQFEATRSHAGLEPDDYQAQVNRGFREKARRLPQ